MSLNSLLFPPLKAQGMVGQSHEGDTCHWASFPKITLSKVTHCSLWAFQIYGPPSQPVSYWTAGGPGILKLFFLRELDALL